MSTDGTDVLIGSRLREIRASRGLTQEVVGQLAGFSKQHISAIERGAQAVDKRSTVQLLADALRVAPSALTGQPFSPSGESEAPAHGAIEGVREALRRIELDDLPPAVSVDDLARRVDSARDASLRCDLNDLGVVLPALAVETTATARSGSARAAGLLVPVMRMTFQLAKDLGFHDVAWIAVGHAHRAALAHADPAWIAMVQFDRARAMIGRGAPAAALALVQRAADDLGKPKDTTAEAYGMLQLSAALQSAIIGARSDVAARLDEATSVAAHTGDGSFADMSFGPRNLAIWRVTLAVETGDLGRVPELAADVDLGAISSADRRASFHVDLGRGLSMLRGRETDAVSALVRGEAEAPQLVHANPFARETVTDLLRRARRDAGGRDLQGIAYRMGMAS